MRAWTEYDRQLDEPRVALHCVVCGAIDRPYVVDATQDGEDAHQCLRCVREAAERRKALRSALSAWLDGGTDAA